MNSVSNHKTESSNLINEIDTALEYAVDSRENVAATASRSGLTRALRIVATILIVGAGAVFLFQGWSHFDSVMRIFSFLGFATLLGITGLVCAFKLKEEKGARTALILSCGLVPVIVSQIGALIYSLGHAPPAGPSIFVLRATSPSQVLMLGGAALLVLLPLMITAFTVMARSRAKVLTAIYAFSNAALLIPLRDPDLVGIMALGLMAVLVSFDMHLLRSDSKLHNFEGRVSRTLPFIPLFLIVVRNLTMYDPSAMLISSIFAGVGAALFFVIPKYTSSTDLTVCAQASGSVFLCGAWAALVHAMFNSLGHGLLVVANNQYYLPSVGLPISLILIALSILKHGDGKSYRIAAGMAAIITVLLHMVIIGGILSSVLCLVVAIVLLTVGYAIEDRSVAAFGVLGIAIGLSTHLRYALVLYSMNPWLSLALLGVTVLVASSYLERNYENLQGSLRTIIDRVRRTK